MLGATQISKSFGAKTLFRGLSMRIQKGDRLGLVGPNGAGKTTLFAILLGDDEPDDGAIERERDIRIGYLPQESAPLGDESVVQLASSVNPDITSLYAIFRAHDDPEHPRRLEALERFAEIDGYAIEAKAKRILAGLAFRPDDFEQPAKRLSGGWIMRAHLARLLTMEPDVLMLDEPTNHLDLETLGWFQSQLRDYSGALLTISHDRAFLDAVCNGVLEIRHRTLHRYTGNYAKFLEQRAEREAQHRAAYRNQQREIAHLEAFVERFRAKASKATQAQSRLKQLEKMERIEAPESDAPTIAFRFPQPLKSGQRVAHLDQVEQAYADHVVYRGLDLTIERGERIVLVGPNGAGKSTLLKILAGVVPIRAGQRELGLNVESGYFSQQRVDVLNVENTVLDEAMLKLADGVREQDVRDLLGAFLFRGDEVQKKVKVLSGGEKSRLALVKLLLCPPNLLLMDEPTTHLDMASIDALVQALKEYSGTLVFVSHDVHFIRAIADKTIHIDGGKPTLYAGGYDYYLRKSGADSERSGLVAGLANARPGATPKKLSSGESAKERRRREAEARQAQSNQRRVIEKRIQNLESQILQLEAEQSKLSEAMERGDAYSDREKARDLSYRAKEVADLLEERNAAWEAAAEDLTRLVDTAAD